MYTAHDLETYEAFDQKFQIDHDRLEKQCEKLRQKIKEVEGKVDPKPVKKQSQAKPSYAHTNTYDALSDDRKPSSPPSATDNRPLKLNKVPPAKRKDVIEAKQDEVRKLERDLKKPIDDAKGRAGRKKADQEQQGRVEDEEEGRR